MLKLEVRMIMQLGELKRMQTWIPGVLLVLSHLVGRCHAMTLHAVFDPWLGSTSHVLDDDGMLWSWGRNAEGQLGDGTTNASVNAVKMALPAGVTRWIQFEAGAGYALLDDHGRLHGWGRAESAGSDLGPTQNVPLLLSDQKWKRVAVPSTRSGLPGMPWALGITDAGALRWIRVRSPIAPGDAPFSNRSIEAVHGMDPALKFREVIAGRHMYLALAESGELFACGVGAWGVLGPNGDSGSTQFQTTFVEVPVPKEDSGWDRIAEADTQSFGWTQSGELYVWGRRFEGKDNLNWGWVTDPVPRHVPRAPGGAEWIRVDGFGESQPSTMLQTDSGQLWVAGDGLDVIHNRNPYPLPGGWSPVQEFSFGGRHSLYLGSDGLVHAMGNNEDFQLGGFPGGEIWELVPMVPGGEAPFLLGTPAEVPVLTLSSANSEILEPTTGSGGGVNGVNVTLSRTQREDLDVYAQLEIRLRRMDGTRILDPEASVLLKDLLSIPNRVIALSPGDTQRSIPWVPRRALKYDEDLWVEVALLPHPSYAVEEGSTVTFLYKHTVPTKYPPEITVLWPPLSQTVHIGEYLGVVFSVIDRDSVAQTAQFTSFDFSMPGTDFPRTMALDPVPPGVEKLYELKIPRTAFFNAGLGPELKIQVVDDTGEKTVVDLGVLRPRLAGLHRLDIQLGSGTQRLSIGSTGSKVVLESSTNLVDWNVVETYTFPLPGFPTSSVGVPGGDSMSRYFRLRNVQ